MAVNWLVNLWKPLKSRLSTIRKSPYGRSFNRTYIFPTKLGVYFGLADLIILSMALIYGNNAIYFLSFFVFSMGLVTMIITNFNLHRLKLSNLQMRSFFADEVGYIGLELQNSGRSTLYSIKIYFKDSSNRVEIAAIDSGETINIKVPLVFKRRGWNECPRLYFETEFPFGFFKSWKVFVPEGKVLIYPARVGQRKLPPQYGDFGIEAIRNVEIKNLSEEVFSGHRIYTKRDSIRRLDWKAYARTKQLLYKLYESEDSSENVENTSLKWQQTDNLLNVEARLSQLTLWSEMCHQRRSYFMLELPGWQSSMGRGELHMREILEHLSTYPGVN